MSLLNFLKPSNPTVPPPGTSAHKAYEYYQDHGRPAPSVPEILGVDPEPNNPSSKPYTPSASGLAASPVNQAVLDYVNADLAKYYGMSKSTAYQEALANTSYQRAVKDMRDAGLNPSVMFGSGRAQSANSSIYAAEEHSGGGGGYSRRGSGSSGNGKLFSSSAYSAIQAIGGLVGIAATGRLDGFWVGSQTAKGAMGLADAVWKK